MLHYLAHWEADRPSLTLLHGLCEDLHIWDNFSEKLAKNTNILRIDLPNFGKSPRKNALSIEDMAEMVLEVLDFLKIPQTILIGHSLGGYVSLAFAEKYPDRLKGLGMFHSTAFADSEEKKANRQKTIDHLLAHGHEAFVRSLFPSLFADLTREKWAKTIENLIGNALVNTEAQGIAATQEAMKNRLDRLQVIENLNVPILYIIGKQDQSVPLTQSLEQCYLPKNSVVHILEGVAHMGLLEAKQQTLQMVEHFIKYCLYTDYLLEDPQFNQ